MAPFRQQDRCKQQRRHDHSVYVQQLFKDFLTRNNGARPATVAPSNMQSGLFNPEIRPRKQPGIFGRAVYARFERDGNGGDTYLRREANVTIKTGLMKWIDQQRNHHQEQQHPKKNLRKTVRFDDYLNLPGNFFSGADQITLPSEVCDKTVGNVSTNFMPRSTSTPFDRMNSFGVSGMLSDPDEFQSTQAQAHSKLPQLSDEWEKFLSGVKIVLTTIRKDQNFLQHCAQELKAVPIDRYSMDNSNDTEKISRPTEVVRRSTSPKTKISDFIPPKAKSQSQASNRNFDSQHKQASSQKSDHGKVIYCPPRNDTFTIEDGSPREDVVPMVSFLESPFPRTRPCAITPEQDMLLTASPPSPSASADHQRSLLIERSFVFDQTRADDTLMEKLDALLEDGENPTKDICLLNFDYDLVSQQDEKAVETAFSNHVPVSQRNVLDQSLNLPETSLRLTPDLTIETFSEFNEILF